MTVAWLTKLSPKLFYLHSLHSNEVKEAQARASMSCQGLDLQHSMEPSPSTTFGYFLHISCPDPAWLLFVEKNLHRELARNNYNQTFPSLSSKVVLQNLGGSPCMMTLMKIGTCAAWILEMPWIRGTLRVNRVHLKIDREKGQRLLCCELFFGLLLIRYVRSLTDYWKSDRFKVWPSFLFRPPPALFYNSRKHAVFLFLGQVKFP